jgi:hypothetical protein
MSQYTMLSAWPDTSDDYEFCVEGRAAGRCYRHYLRFYRVYCWHWTVYGSSLAGDELTLEAAQAKFKSNVRKKGRNAEMHSLR